MAGRQQGKSYTANLAKEAALDAGKTVMVVTADSATLQRRQKHLTMIETLPRKEPEPLIIYDDYYS